MCLSCDKLRVKFFSYVCVLWQKLNKGYRDTPMNSPLSLSAHMPILYDVLGL
jgi:hypothetical protein